MSNKNEYGYMAKIGGDTSGLQQALQDAEKELKEAENGIKALDKAIVEATKNSSDTSELLAARESAYAKYVRNTADQLTALTGIQEQVEQAFQKGIIGAGEYATYMAQLAQATERYNKTQQELAENTSEQVTAYDNYKTSVEETDKTLKDMERELTAVNSAMKIAGDTEELMSQKSALLEDTVDALTQKLSTLEDQEGAVSQAFLDGEISTEQYNEFERQIEVTKGQLEAYRNELEQVNKELQSPIYNEYKEFIDSANNSLKENKLRLSEINESIKNANSAHLSFNSTLELNKQKQEALKEISSELKVKLNELKLEAADMKEALKLGNINQQQYDDFRRSIIDTKAELANLKNQTGEYSEKAAKASDNTSTFADALKANLTSAAIIKGVEALAAAIGEIVSDINELINASMQAGDTIDKQSQILGLSREAYQEWDYVLNMNGASIGSMTTATRKLTEAVEKENSAFGSLGLSMNEVRNMTREELFESVIFGLQGITDEQQRNSIANDLLGRSYTQLIPLLNQSTESTRDLMQAAHENNMLMSDEAVNAAVKYKDSLTTLQYTLDGIKNNLLSRIMPGLALITEGVSDIAAGSEDGAEKIADGFTDTAEAVFNIISEVMENVERVVEIAIEHIPEIIDENSDELLSSGQEVLQNIITGLTERINDVVDVGVNILKFILRGLLNTIGTLGSEFGNIVTSIIAALIAAIPDVIEFSIELCNSIARDIVNYDWVGMANAMVDNLIGGLENAWAKVQVWLDNTFSGGQLYGGDVNNVTFGAGWEEWKETYKTGINELYGIQETWQDRYRRGLEELGISTDETVDDINDAAAQITEAADEADESIISSSARVSTAASKDSEKREKAIKDSTKKAMDSLKRTQKEQGLDDNWLMEQYKKLADGLEKGSDAYYLAYDAYLDTREKIRKADEQEAEKDRKQRIQELEDRKKDAENSLKALKKQHEDEVKAKKKEAEDNLSLLEETQEEYTKTAAQMSEKVKSNGKDRLILGDNKEESKKLQKYRSAMDKLKALGVSEELLASVYDFDYNDGSRQMYINELLGMSANNRAKYDKEYQEYVAEQKKTAEYDTGLKYEDERKSLQDAANGVLEEPAEQAYQWGVKAGENYIKGLETAIANFDGIADVFTMNTSGKSSAGGQSSGEDSANSTGNQGNSADNGLQGISPQTVISINVAGKEVIRGEIGDFLMEKISSGGSLNV